MANTSPMIKSTLFAILIDEFSIVGTWEVTPSFKSFKLLRIVFLILCKSKSGYFTCKLLIIVVICSW